MACAFIAPARVVEAHFRQRSFSYKIFKATQHSFLNFFFVAHFNLTTVSYGIPSHFHSASIDYLLNLSYYSTILSGNNTSVFYHIILPGALTSSVTLRLFCSRRIVLVFFLLAFASVHIMLFVYFILCFFVSHLSFY